MNLVLGLVKIPMMANSDSDSDSEGVSLGKLCSSDSWMYISGHLVFELCKHARCNSNAALSFFSTVALFFSSGPGSKRDEQRSWLETQVSLCDMQ